MRYARQVGHGLLSEVPLMVFISFLKKKPTPLPVIGFHDFLFQRIVFPFDGWH